jgi:hypothetical protein
MIHPIRSAIHRDEPTPEEEAAWSAEIEVRKAELKQKHLEELKQRTTTDKGTGNTRWYQYEQGCFVLK